MQLIILAALLATLAHSEAIPAPGTAEQAASGLLHSELWRGLFILLTTLAAPLATACDGRWFLTRLQRPSLAERTQWQQAGERYERLQLAGLWLWLACSLAVIYLWDWPALIRFNWGWSAWPVIDDALVLSPVIASLLLVWTTFFYVERTAQRLRAQENRTQRIGTLLSYLTWQCRHYLAMALIPAFVVIAVQEICFGSSSAPSTGATTSSAAWLFAVPALVLLPAALPLLLRRIWPTCDLPAGELREQLSTISREMRTPLTRILIWQTQGRMTNAAVAGLSRHCRYLFLTDALLVQLAPGEIAAVVRHELGHLQRRHLLLRLLVLALPALVWFALQPLLGIRGDLLSTSSPYALAVSAAYLVYAVLIVGQYSQWLEYDADLAAVIDERGTIHADSARDLIHALAVLQGPQRESRFTHWMHPPTTSRIAWIRRVLMQPQQGLTYRWRLDRVSRAIYAITIALAIFIFLVALAI